MAISAIKQADITAALAALEQSNEISILYACESGSRAWGFASEDSDYDVRFLYVHSVDWYLQLFPGADTIDKMLPGELDLSGWDLKKSLMLLAKSNMSLLEWLDSPIQYSVKADFLADINEVAIDWFDPTKAYYHYYSMAKKMADLALTTDVNVKKLFYFLRALYACYWIAENNSQPPTEFSKLRLGVSIEPQLSEWINESLAWKLTAKEGDKLQVAEHQVASISQLYTNANQFSVRQKPAPNIVQLDGLFKRWLPAE